MGECGENQNNGPPPNLKTRQLIFDSMQTIIREGSGDAGSGKVQELARYVYVCGAGYHAQLGRKAGRGEKKYANIPIPVTIDAPIREISCGALHTAVVTDDGDVLTWGDCSHGQLGHAGANYAMWPIPKDVFIEGGPAKTVACGQNHTVAITMSDEAFAWGLGKYGQLGNGRTRTCRQATPVTCDDPEFKGLLSVSCGDRHTCFVTRSGRIFTCGSGEHGQLGDSHFGVDAKDQLVPKRVEFFENHRIVQADCGSIHTAAVTDEGKLYVWGFGEHLYGIGKPNFNPTPIRLDFKHKIVQVACGQSHMLLLTDTGDVYSWGSGEYGEIGQGAFKAQFKPVLVLVGKNIANVKCGRYHSAALSRAGILYMWGCGDNGQLGRPESSQDNFVKQACSVPKVVNSMTGNVIGAVSCGEHHSCFIASCRYVDLPEEIAEWGTLEEMEYEFKVNIASRHRGRGIPRRDIFKIRRWRRDEERRRCERREKEAMREQKRAKNEAQKIVSGEKYREELCSPEKRHQVSIAPDMVSTTSSISTQRQRVQRQRQPRISETNVNRRQRRKAESMTSVTSKQANQARASFHEKGAGILGSISSTLYDFQNPKIDGVQYTQEDMMKRKFVWRKKYDKLSLIKKKRSNRLTELEEELEMLQEAEIAKKGDVKGAQITREKLEMQLNTINIKINEAERNRKTYELNISNIKDESQETHKQLDIQRRQLAYEDNLRKKVSKFCQHTQAQRDISQGNIKDFKAELSDWKNFLQMIIVQMTSLTKGKEENDKQQREEELKKADDIKRSKTMKKVEELLEKVDHKEKEALVHREIRREYECEINKYREMFDKIKKVTNKENPHDIIIKFQLNSEVREEYQSIRNTKHKQYLVLNEEHEKLTKNFHDLTSSKQDHTWREVDTLQEKLQMEETNLNSKISQVGQINTSLEQLKEWMTSIISKYNKYLSEWDGVEDRISQANRDDIAGVLESLQSRIKTFRQIIQHQANGTDAIFKKKVTA